MQVGDIISMSVTDFIKLAPRGLILQTRNNVKLHYANNHYRFDNMILEYGWGNFTAPTEPVENIHGYPYGFDEEDYENPNSLHLKVIQLPTLTAIRRP